MWPGRSYDEQCWLLLAPLYFTETEVFGNRYKLWLQQFLANSECVMDPLGPQHTSCFPPGQETTKWVGHTFRPQTLFYLIII